MSYRQTILDHSQIREHIQNGCVFTIFRYDTPYEFRSYIYQRKLFVKYRRHGASGNETHLGRIVPSGAALNKQYNTGRQTYAMALKRFVDDLFGNDLVSHVFRFELHQLIPDSMADTRPVQEIKDDENYLYRLGL